MKEGTHFPQGGTLAHLAELLRMRQVSSMELTLEALRRLETIGPSLHSVATLTRERAMDEARAADRRWRAGAPRSLLDGIPYAVKDALADRTVATQWGSPAFSKRRFHADAAVVQRLSEAGGVLVAKVALIQLCGAGGYRSPDASITGPCLNPWDQGRWSGGSSSGSASSVAADLVPLAIGTDTTGSIVAPAAFCGITGLRPSWGLVSRAGCCPVSWSMDVIGPMARSAADCEAALALMGVPEPRDPAGRRRSGRAPGRRLRLGVARMLTGVTGAVEAAFNRAIEVLTEQGLEAHEIDLPLEGLDPLAMTIMNVEASAAHTDLLASPAAGRLLDTGQADGLRRGAAISARDYSDALERRARFVADLDELFETIDLIAAPTRNHEAPAADRPIDRSARGPSRISSLAGLPSISIPMGFGDGGMPLGLWLAGRRFEDDVVLDSARHYQTWTDWHLCRAPASPGALDQLGAVAPPAG